MNLIQEHKSDIKMFVVLSIIVVVLIIGMSEYSDYNDKQYFKTLDKLTCDQIWEKMIAQGSDWDTTDYFGDRCN